jgi:enoyl-CoA hydratase/carnithine racemase
MPAPLIIDRQPGHWTFTLDRSEKRNALSHDLVEALIEGVEAAHREGVPLLVFRGAGKNFSAGFDFTGYETQSEGDLVLRLIRIETLLQLVANSPALTVGLVHGRNFGAGVDLFAACKLRYCTPDASFRMPGLKFGLVLGTRRFRNIVGVDEAMSILGTARPFDADESLRIGFVTSIVPENEWAEILSEAESAATVLDPETRSVLYGALNVNEADTDMAALVRSASRPGIKRRIQQYLAG